MTLLKVAATLPLSATDPSLSAGSMAKLDPERDTGAVSELNTGD